MKKQIRRNATKKIEAILKSVTKVEYFISDNNYQGGKIENGFTERELKSTFDDVREGYAILFEKEDGTYQIRMAGRCRWEMTV